MSRSITAALHAATHQVPGVPEHRDRPDGHQGRSPNPPHGSPRRAHRSGHHGSNRSPRVLAGWQRRIAALFGQRVG
jgi:hypothetical protein